jgi:serine protease
MVRIMMALGVSLGLCCTILSAAQAAPAARWSTDKLIVRFEHEGLRSVQSVRPQDLVPGISLPDGGRLRSVRRFNADGMVVRLPRMVSSEEAWRLAERLAAQPGIASAQPDKRMYPALVPNDPDYLPGANAFVDPGQWYLFEDTAGIRMPAAWDRTTGSSDVVIAQLDTGILGHRDLDPLGTRILPGYDFVSELDTANDGDGRDADPTDPGDWAEPGDVCYVGDPNNPELDHSSWHGLSVAGVMVAEANNALDIAGIDFAARLLPLRVLGTCGGLLSDVADAIRWAVGLPVAGVPALNPSPARVINLSLSGAGACSPEEQLAIDAAVNAGAVVIVAAGNQGLDVADFSPANCNNVITVGAVDRDGSVASYMNVGEEIDLSAPAGDGDGVSGEGILTLFNDGATVPGQDILAYIQGTSFAAAQVSAVAALMWAVNDALDPGTIGELLRRTARTRSFPDSSCNTLLCGEGILDADAALAGAADPVSVLPASNDLGGGGGGGGCSVAGTVNRHDLSLLLALAACGLLCTFGRVRTVF